MYTEFHFNSALKKNTPNEVIDTLKFMLGETENLVKQSHPLFDTERWEYMLRMDSYYFDADTHSTLRFDEIAKQYYLCVRCNLKNYNGEIKKFLDWIFPYLDKMEGEFVGFSRYEEFEEPTLIYYNLDSK